MTRVTPGTGDYGGDLELPSNDSRVGEAAAIFNHDGRDTAEKLRPERVRGAGYDNIARLHGAKLVRARDTSCYANDDARAPGQAVELRSIVDALCPRRIRRVASSVPTSI